ncbi:amino acid ABC transporter substrate-binding protein [Comamonas aquatica]|jgi:glutamate/aspartate transport system substrate-binding protein|uniref:Glutamate/aspartate periplasmic-binding protein n=1 Tax=Comamonas aquatica TaxID=225991 RepID=A0AA35D9D1_9BURK|nr:amino acid ABC transporter substrate-binding protein [Comamonas aquatica]MDH0898945.1 amino acid ABC transporter substrate-binding protein [Comamonas aquatica]CAB5679542.1 Glutamate/aspartate periplasmic-binding protein precursor [Comamonas aquatica]CAB5699166.1 Glutamate/aspartate periplasmic-binding protein precursor [Comamonas aquatica]CAC9197392.1 Glutamate/aspartate periplasmic-binding protein precursor [Comamonas aquatica]CAC9689625.1 Glutamate/aspartate periplasmic-binding protein pr
MKKHLLAVAVMALAAGSAMAQANDTLAKVKSSGSITLGVRESSGALGYTLGDGKYVGFHTEMAENIASDLRKQLGLSKLETKYQPVTSQNRIPLVVNGTVDLECGSTTNDLNRQKDVDFANTTYVEQVRIAVKANSGINDVKDLNGKTVATTTGTTSVQLLRQNKRAEGIEFKNIMGKDHADSFLLLETGRADAFVMDGSILAGNISKSKNAKDFKIVGEPLSTEPIACMVRKNDPAFLKAVNDSIARQVKDGTLAKLWDKWFIQPIPPANVAVGLPLSEATKNAWNNPNNKPKEDYNK